jgi:hypothetical protein
VVEVVAEDLPFADRDVGSEVAGRGEHAEGQRVEDLDRTGAAGVSYPEQLSSGLQQAVGVGVLDDDASHVVADHG